MSRFLSTPCQVGGPATKAKE